MAKKILIYGLGIFFSKIIVFLLIPIYTRCFSTTDYGYYDVLVTNLLCWYQLLIEVCQEHYVSCLIMKIRINLLKQ